jgi:hypothetical protein
MNAFKVSPKAERPRERPLWGLRGVEVMVYNWYMQKMEDDCCACLCGCSPWWYPWWRMFRKYVLRRKVDPYEAIGI